MDCEFCAVLETVVETIAGFYFVYEFFIEGLLLFTSVSG